MTDGQDIVAQARELLAKDDLQGAIARLEGALARDPKQIEARVLLAKLKGATGDFEGFKRLADEALRVSLDRAESYLLKGMACGFQRDFEEACRFYEMSLDKDSGIPLTHTNLGIARRELGDYKGAEAALRQARQLDPQDAEICYHLAQTLALQLRVKEAIDELLTALRVNPFFLPAYLALGAIYTEGDDRKNAIEIYQAALKARPDAAEPRARLLELFIIEQQPQQALEMGRQLVAARGTIDDYLQHGLAAIAAEQYQEAERAFLTACERSPQAWEPHYNLAELYDVLELDEAAGRAYEMAVSLNRGSFKPHNGYGLYLLRKGQTETAVDHLIEAYELSDDEPEPPYNLALAFVQAERLDDARQVLKESLAAGRLDYLQADAERLLAQLG